MSRHRRQLMSRARRRHRLVMDRFHSVLKIAFVLALIQLPPGEVRRLALVLAHLEEWRYLVFVHRWY